MLIGLSTFDQVKDLIERTNQMDSEEERIRVLCSHYYSPEMPSFGDPTRPEYRTRVMEIYAEIHGANRKTYQPTTDEQSPFIETSDIFRTAAPFNYQSSAFVGEFLITYGFILKCMDVRSGARILEYGPGSGQILLNLARLGCSVTAVDIEPNYLELIRLQARAMGLDVDLFRGSFGDAPDEAEPYDAVLFFEAFHHCLDHQMLVQSLHRITSDTGQIVFAGEPIIAPDDYWRPTIPYPWGPRLDALSLRATKAYGWLELGFQEEYFVRLMLQNGWFVKKYPCALTGRGDTWIAKKNLGTWVPGVTALPADEAMTWHEPEPEHVWTKQSSIITLDERPRWQRVAIECQNLLPIGKTVELELCGDIQVIATEPLQRFVVEFTLSRLPRRLVISCPESVPRDMGWNDDDRKLGIAVRRISYLP